MGFGEDNMPINTDAPLYFVDSDGSEVEIGTLKSIEIDEEKIRPEKCLLTNIDSDKVWSFTLTAVKPSRAKKTKGEIREDKIWKAYARVGYLINHGKTKRIRKKNQKRMMYIFDLMEKYAVYY